MNQSAKLNWILITFPVEIVALMPIILHDFMLGWKWRFFRVNDTTRNAFSTDSFN